MKPHESPRINKKSIRGDSRDSWPVWNRGIKWSVQVNVLLRNCKQNTTSLSLLAGRTVLTQVEAKLSPVVDIKHFHLLLM